MAQAFSEVGPMGSAGTPQEELAERAETLCHRLMDIEQALAAQEWWLLGRALPEARLLAEIASLLAVARGELENILAQYFNRPTMRAEQPEQSQVARGPSTDELKDPAWLAANREQAVYLLRVVATALPPMMQYALLLHTNAEKLGMPSAGVDSFGIVADRLNDSYEALREPPR
jgi:hypothetical protein